MASESSQTQLKRDDLMNEAQAAAYNEHMKEVTGQQQQSEQQHEGSYLEKSGEQVKSVAQGAADMATGAARGAVYMTQGAAAGAASFGHGVANAVSSTFGTNKQNKSS